MPFFFRQYLRNLRAVGALAPSGTRLSRAPARSLSDNGRALSMLAVGPGTGAVMRLIVANMTTAGLGPPRAVLISCSPRTWDGIFMMETSYGHKSL